MKINFENNKVLVLSPHTDDLEFNCGGFVSKILSERGSVASVVFSRCEESVPEPYPKNQLENECIAAHKLLRISELEILNFVVRKFSEQRQEILELMIKLRDKYQPDIILVPSSFDMHQDHKVICEEATRAFKHATILGYDCPWNNLETNQRLVVELSEDEVKNKIAAIQCYKSQKFRMYGSDEFQKLQTRYNGLVNGVEYCELYEIITMRWSC